MTISRRDFLTSAGAAIAAPRAQAAIRPNVVVLLSDQQHWQALGIQDKFFDTPNLDKLAAESFVFENAFCTTPQCSPSRSSLLTGWYPSKTGVFGNVGAPGGNQLRMPTFGAALREAGYSTGYFGKWHLGNRPEAAAGWQEHWIKGAERDFIPNVLGFLKRQAAASSPFVLFVSCIDPHRIYDFKKDMRPASGRAVPLPDSWHKETFRDKPSVQKQFMTEDQGTEIWGEAQRTWEAYRDFYRTQVRNYDRGVGAVLEALTAHGLAGKTMVICTSDHGDMDTHHKLIFKGPFMYEHMVRIPLIVRVPAAVGGAAPHRVRDFDTVNTDIAPTLMEFAGVQPRPCHGQSLKPILTGSGTMRNRPFVIGQYYGKQDWVNPIRMIRTAEFKYNRYLPKDEELYDLKNDPGELVNLAGDSKYRKTKSELEAELKRWIEANGDPFYSQRATDPAGKPYPGR